MSNLQRISYSRCPLCNSASFRPLAKADCSHHALYDPAIPSEMQWMECNDCSHVFTDGYFGDDINAILFGKSQRNQLPGFDPELGRSISGRIVDRVAQYHEPPGRWLDVGFGEGTLLHVAQEWGYDPVGIDMRQHAVDGLSEQGIPAYRKAIADMDGTFGVISMADVLEHMAFPAPALRKVHGLLAPDGILFVSCPNAGCMAWDFLTRQHANPYWVEIEHFHNFTRKRLTQLLAECGFTVLRYGVSERYRLGMELICGKA